MSKAPSFIPLCQYCADSCGKDIQALYDERHRLSSEHRNAFVAGWLACCDTTETATDGAMKFHPQDETSMAEHGYERWQNSVSGRRDD